MNILALFEGSSLQESEQNENSYFPNTVPFSNTKFSDYKFDRLDGIFNQRPINQLIDDGMKPNWSTGSQIIQDTWKIILSQILYSLDWISNQKPISHSTLNGKLIRSRCLKFDWGRRKLITAEILTKRKFMFSKFCAF